MNLEEKKAFLTKLINSSEITKRIKGRELCACPECHKGKVIVKCRVKKSGKGISYHYTWQCDTCHERFWPGKVKAQIFLETPFEEVNYLDTPFGRISVTINGISVPFHLRKEKRMVEYQPEGGEVPIYYIDIDTTTLQIKDIISCGFEKAILSFFTSDEYESIYTAENDDYVLGFLSYDTGDYDKHEHCYIETCRLHDVKDTGYEGDDDLLYDVAYYVHSDPDKYDIFSFPESKIITLQVTWIKKDLYREPFEVIDELLF